MSKNKKLKIILLPIIIIWIILLCGFYWPIAHFKLYEYHTIESENDHGDWWINFDPISETFSKPVVIICESPYHLSMMHDAKLKIDRVVIEDSGTAVFTSNDFKRYGDEWSHWDDVSKRVSTICDGIEIDYGDYDLVIYYSLEEQGQVVEHIFKEPLKTCLTDEKVSLFEILSSF